MQGFPKLTDTTFDNTHLEFLSALLYGGKCLGYENISVDDAAPVSLDAENNFSEKRYALLYVEAGGGVANASKVIRFREDGVAPTALEGMPLGDNGLLDVKGDNIADFQMIGIDVGVTHSVKVLYYGKG